MSTANTQTGISKYHFPLKENRLFGKMDWACLVIIESSIAILTESSRAIQDYGAMSKGHRSQPDVAPSSVKGANGTIWASVRRTAPQ